MGVVMGVTAVVLEIAAALVGLMVWTALLFPQRTARARAALEARPGRCFVTGLCLAVLLGIPVRVLLRSPHGLGKLTGWLLAFPLLVVLALGLAAMAELLGARLQQRSTAVTSLGALVCGAVTLELAAALPFLGWFLFAPVVGLTLLGAGAAGSVSRDGFEPQRHRGHGGSGERENRDGQDRQEEAVGAIAATPWSSLSAVDG